MNTTLKDLKRLQATLKATQPETKEHYSAAIMYHDAASEYWDNQVGSSVTHDDLYCTKKWEYHQGQLDVAYRRLRKFN